MIAAALLWLSLSIAFPVIAPRLTLRLRPATGVRLAVASAWTLIGAGVFVLAAAASTWAAQRPDVAEVGDWSAATLHADDPVPAVVSVICAIVLSLSATSLGVHFWRRVRAIRAVRAVVASASSDGDVVIVEDDRPDAFATPGPRGRVIITSALMQALAPGERAALVAHERSHLRHRHIWWQLAIHAAAAANPLLRRTCHAVDHAIERWADEDAAAEVADRRLVAQTLARVSLLKKRGTVAVRVTLAATGGDVPARVRALLKPPARRSRLASVVLVLFILGALVATVVMQRNTDALFDAAQQR